jgi:hypothetical protein
MSDFQKCFFLSHNFPIHQQSVFQYMAPKLVLFPMLVLYIVNVFPELLGQVPSAIFHEQNCQQINIKHHPIFQELPFV